MTFKKLVVALTFGEGEYHLPNQYISEMAYDEAMLSGGLIFTQADFQKRRDRLLPTVVYIKPEREGCPPPTLCILEEAVRYAEENRWDEICIVCAKPHKNRIAIDFSRIETNVKLSFSRKIDELEVDWFRANKQIHTSSREEWRKREKLIGLLPFILYKLLSILKWKYI